MKMERNSGLYDLDALYAFCDGKNEPLIKHLEEVSYLCGKLCEQVGLRGEVGSLAGLFHDVGKAIPEFQRSCSFFGHEVISFAVVSLLIENELVKLEDPIERGAVRYAILFHHQAHRWVYYTIKNMKDKIKKYFSDSSIVELLSKLVEYLLKNYTNVAVNREEIKDLLASLASKSLSNFTGRLFNANGKEFNLKEISILRAYSGALMVSDKYISVKARRGSEKSPYFGSVNALIKSLGGISSSINSEIYRG